MIISKPNLFLAKKHLFCLFLAALTVRLFFFLGYVSHETRYQQPDSIDYHNSALCLYLGAGMYRIDTHEPIFWRTPGYPFYLSLFYTLFPSKKFGFDHWSTAHFWALIVQILLCSLIPLLVVYLTLIFTHNQKIALISGWAVVFHIGFILASMYLLTEGLAVLLFIAFLCLCYRAMRSEYFLTMTIVLAALTLGAYTWIRPMGQFVAIAITSIWVIFGQGNLALRFKKTLLFLTLFLITITPWYIRNHALTGHWFFCPMSGPYLNSFCAPKILRTIREIPLEQSIRILHRRANQRIQQAQRNTAGTGYVVSKEWECNAIALPIIKEHPWLFLKDWTKEVIKTTFDLYSYQLAALAAGTFKYDPLEEFLTEKLASCLYQQAMPWWMRIICYFEVLFSFILWVGIFGGIIWFMFMPFFYRHNSSNQTQYLHKLWWQVIPLIIAVLWMTGGFGYARLRLPVESLLIIMSLTWWYYVINKKHIEKANNSIYPPSQCI
ncbi:hypothetical protein KJZ61_03875 [Candidatus Dependentiae bacterium]|nr:hypothetical protein [Candidatus Dependentiae bacterium]